MPIQPNILERFAFFTLNAAPTPMLDLAGALGYQALSTAVRLDLFNTLQNRPSTLTELAQNLNCQERGLNHLLKALDSLGYVALKNDLYHNTVMTEKWFTDGTMLDLNNAVACWDAFLHDLWPHAPKVIRSGERPYNFYDYTASQPGLSHTHQQMMFGNANLNAPDVTNRVKMPAGPTRRRQNDHYLYSYYAGQANGGRGAGGRLRRGPAAGRGAPPHWRDFSGDGAGCGFNRAAGVAVSRPFIRHE